MDLIKRYQQLNESYHRKLIHHFGTGNGFYSELNSLLFSTLFCLQNKLRLELYSKDATFTFGNGWTEYFEPFCPEFKNDYIGKRISRDYINNHRDKHICYLYKIFTKNDILNDIYWYCRSGWFEHSHFCIPELGIDGDIRQAMKVRKVSLLVRRVLYEPTILRATDCYSLSGTIRLSLDICPIATSLEWLQSETH